jgi:hypothetical protein
MFKVANERCRKEGKIFFSSGKLIWCSYLYGLKVMWLLGEPGMFKLLYLRANVALYNHLYYSKTVDLK